jgi:hypothetical protein
MIKGSCLCGGVKFEIRGSKGPFELCHCNRCRKATGSAFAAGLRVRGEDLRIVQGQELIKTFEAPIIDCPPPYTNRFCGRCGSPVRHPTLRFAQIDCWTAAPRARAGSQHAIRIARRPSRSNSLEIGTNPTDS